MKFCFFVCLFICVIIRIQHGLDVSPRDYNSCNNYYNLRYSKYVQDLLTESNKLAEERNKCSSVKRCQQIFERQQQIKQEINNYILPKLSPKEYRHYARPALPKIKYKTAAYLHLHAQNFPVYENTLTDTAELSLE